MNWSLIAIGITAVLAAAGLVMWLVRYGTKRAEARGKLSESARLLAEEQNRRDRFETRMAEPLDRPARDAWDRLRARRRRQRMSDGEGTV